MTNREKLKCLSDVDFSETVVEKICELLFQKENLKLELCDVKNIVIVNFEHWLAGNAIEGKRRCRICGCTDDRACPGGCYWVEEDLCSKCAEEKK